MARKITKALRGKHRWIGCVIDGFNSRSELEHYLGDFPVKLFDHIENKCVLRVALGDYEEMRSSFETGRVISSTSSGKIRLVRERMGIVKKPRKR